MTPKRAKTLAAKGARTAGIRPVRLDLDETA